MGWMCEPVEEAVIMHFARCGTCGWQELAVDRSDAQHRADLHREAHEYLWESSGNTDLGESLNPARSAEPEQVSDGSAEHRVR